MTTLRDEPHYEIDASELAAWVEAQGLDLWWSVDGDPLLMGNLSLPCPGDELAAELRRINRPLLIRAPADEPAAGGQKIDRTGVDRLAVRFIPPWDVPPGERPLTFDEREIPCAWKSRGKEWLLIEDLRTTASERENHRAATAPNPV